MDKDLDFEKELKRLDEITRKMEDKNLPLDESIKLYEEGIKITEALQKALKDAETKVEKIIESK